MLQCADAGRRVVASGNSRRAAIVLTQVSPAFSAAYWTMPGPLRPGDHGELPAGAQRGGSGMPPSRG